MTPIEYLNTIQLPSVSSAKQKRRKQPDILLFLSFVATTAVSLGATIYYFENHETLLYNDAYAHLFNARIVLDSLTPGLTQLGTVWLPLQHLLMLPLIWNDTLWETGLAGTIPSMVSFVVAAIYLFCALRRFTRNTAISLIGLLFFLSNPNILYLQTTPLPEVMYAAAFSATVYYLVCWLETYHQRNLIRLALAVAIASLIRFDGWALFLAVTGIVFIVKLLEKGTEKVSSDQIFSYLAIAPLGVMCWLIWNRLITGNPLYFEQSQYSSQAQQLYFLQRGELPTYHNLLTSLQVYSIDTGQSVGWGLLISAIASAVLVLLVFRRKREILLLGLMAVPFLFYVITLYTGSSIIDIPGAGSNTLFNVRYGVQMVIPVVFLIALGLDRLMTYLHLPVLRVILLTLSLIGIGAQVLLINETGIIALQDGLVGRSCIDTTTPVILALSQHYDGGYILVDHFNSDINPQLFHANLKSMIYEGSGLYWKEALADPVHYVNWVILNPYKQGDLVAPLYLRNKQQFLSEFTRIASDQDGLQLYYRRNAPSFPTRPLSSQLVNTSHTCTSDA